MKNLNQVVFLIVNDILQLQKEECWKEAGELQRASYKLFSYAFHKKVLKYLNEDSTNYGMIIEGYDSEEFCFHDSLILGNQKEFIKM